MVKKSLFYSDQLLGKTWVGSEAVKRAGFRVKNDQRAAEMAYQLLHKTPVREAVNRAMLVGKSWVSEAIKKQMEAKL